MSELDENAEAGEALAGAAKRQVFKVTQYVDEKQMKKDLSYSPQQLTEAMMDQASTFAYYGVQAAKASRQVDVVKMLLETAEAAVYRKLRDESAIMAIKVTEAQLEKMVSRDDRVLAFKKALNEAKQIEATAKIAVEAFRHRRDMLVQQGLLNREELKGELAISAKTARENEFEMQKNAVLARRQLQMSQAAE